MSQSIANCADSCINPFETPQTQLMFNDLVKKYSGDLYRYAYWLSHDASISEDLVQETFLRAWRAIKSLREQRAVKSWLFTILRRENARRFERYQPEMPDINTETLPGDDASRNETETWLLRRHISELSPKYSEPLILQTLGGFSCEEIGNMLGLSRGAVMTRVFRAKHKLQILLDRE